MFFFFGENTITLLITAIECNNIQLKRMLMVWKFSHSENLDDQHQKRIYKQNLELNLEEVFFYYANPYYINFYTFFLRRIIDQERKGVAWPTDMDIIKRK